MLLLFLLAVFATWLSLSLLRTAEFQSGLLLLATSMMFLLPRAWSLEIRYIAASLVLVVIWIVRPFNSYSKSDGVNRGSTWIHSLYAICFALYLTAVVMPQDIRSWHRRTDVRIEQLDYRHMAQQVAKDVGQEDAIVTELPYLFAFFTGWRAVLRLRAKERKRC